MSEQKCGPSSKSLTVSVDEAAELLGVSRDLVYDAVKRGEIASIRLGHRIRISRPHLLERLGVTEADLRLPDEADNRCTCNPFAIKNAERSSP